ncbi:hypothetical protein, partial [Pontibacterium sp.]|uniref:hypothetical protein n=1 Tax=Pontibacterium sp. TaxID=2036026 RepID=UPI003561349B
MQYMLNINQVRMVEWKLNLQQAVLFAFLYEVPSWADPVVVDGVGYFRVTKQEVAEALPAISTKPDTIKRYMAALESTGLIRRVVLCNQPHF